MASYVETTAVALRKGDTPANLNFTGVLGEVVADLGYEEGGILGIDINATLRLHNGVTKGGIPLCRADTRNITSQVLAENRQAFDDKNLAYADLSNIEETTNDDAKTVIVTTLNGYGLATKVELQETADTLALKDMTNVLTSSLASGRGDGIDGNLAYADTSNVNTSSLVDPNIHDGKNGDLPLSYMDMSNVDTTNLTLSTDDRPTTLTGPVLAKNDLTNVSKEALFNTLFDPTNELYIERTTNKDNTIPVAPEDITAEHYPTTYAVNTFIKERIEAGRFMTKDLLNIESFDVLTSNGENKYKYDSDSANITKAGTGFTVNELYWTGKKFEGTSPIKVQIAAVTNNEPTAITFNPPFGSIELPATLTITSELNDGTIVTSTITTVSTLNPDTKLYHYSASNITTNPTGLGGFELGEELVAVENPQTDTLLNIRVLGLDENNGITNFVYSPAKTDTFFETESLIIYPDQTATARTNAEITLITQDALPAIGGGHLAKTDLTNLLGMSNADAEHEKDSPWRISHEENIPSIKLADVSDDEFYNISNNGRVWMAIQEAKEYNEQLGGVPQWQKNTAYIITPGISKVMYNGVLYYCKEAHTSGEDFDPTKWEVVNNTVFEALANKDVDISLNTTSDIKYPTNKAVVTYVKEQIDAMHTPGHYHGQVNIMVPTETNLPGESDPSTEYTITPTEGLTALISNYNGTNNPAIATYTNNAWTYETLILQNGVYVYVLNLGKTYYDGPGNATWNTDTTAFDIAPDKFQVPDGKTLDLNASTGAIQIVPALQTKLDYVDVSGSIQTSLDGLDTRVTAIENTIAGMIIPAPQFFTGTGVTGQVLALTDNVAFDLYVNGVFQYPNTYIFDATSKTITLNWVVENTQENGIAIIYRGFRKV